MILAQISAPGVTIPEIPWAALSPELVLFFSGILVLLLDTAGSNRVRMSALVGVLVIGGAAFAGATTGVWTVAGLVILAAVTQFALTVLWQERPRLLGALLTSLGFVATLGVVAWQWAVHQTTTVIATDSFLNDMVAVDGVALFTRITICVAGLVTVPLGFAYLEDRKLHRGEYYPLLLLASTGMTLLASANDLLMVFIAVEVLSLALYIMAAFARRDLNAQESAFKYFMMGAFSSAFLLYGIAIAYGATGTTSIPGVGAGLASLSTPQPMAVAAIALMIVGLAFKAALVPFHMWTPDVYQGAPSPVTGFMAAATKAAAFAAVIRIFVGALWPLQWSWQPIFWVIAVATMMLGAVLAVVQLDVKRILAYSAIAHAGYVVIGVSALSASGVGATLLYLLVYAFMSLGTFGVLSLLERRRGKAIAINDIRGLGRRSPMLAGVFSLLLLSLAGIPGTAGFIAKLGLFGAGVEAGLARGDYWLIALVVFAVISSIISAFFYIRLIIVMFADDEPDELAEVPVPTSTGSTVGLAVTGLAMVVLGILPAFAIDLAQQAASLAG